MHERPVKQCERLRGHRGSIAPLAGKVEARPVEHFDHRIDQAALLKRVNRAAIALALQRRGVIGRSKRSHPAEGMGAVLEDGQAYDLLSNTCKQNYARAFKLYKIYERGASFAGHRKAE